jgi:hypothetical protein
MSLINNLILLIIIPNISNFNNMRLILVSAFTLFILILPGNAQPKLEIEPHNIRFEDMFNRLEVVYLINEGDEPLVIDSIAYKNDLYFIRFDGYARYPFTIQPDDSVRMDCILAGYLYVASQDTVDTMYVYNNGVKPKEDARIKIDYFDDDFRFGTINGYVTDGITSLENSIVHFYYQGTFIIDTAHTDASGFYSKKLPPGSYIAAAEKTDYYVSFYDSLFDPFTAKTIRIAPDSLSNADIKLTSMESTPISVSGTVFDSLSGTYLKKGAIIVRKGTHTPTRPLSGVEALPSDVYTTFLRSDGTYLVDNIIDEDHYYIQAFSDYFIPSYYSSGNNNPVFWQQADSVFLNTNLSNVNIHMPRDSSIGGGNVNGSILIGDASDFSDVVIYVQSMSSNLLYTYGIAEDNGSFGLSFLPYGTYKLVGQKLGHNNGHSQEFTINPSNTTLSGIHLIFDPLTADGHNFIPEDVRLYQNYPNPFNPATTIEFYLPKETYVRLSIYNVLGEETAVLKDNTLREGNYKVYFDASSLTSGVYFVRLETNSSSISRKILLVK